ncbi:MAG: tRNA pseudouridine(55) synthase TruB, partial [Deltaproteobacteria bacterium]
MNGVVVIDKPSGRTSANVVAFLKKALQVGKIGHIGTLDPLATGVLPICIGEATKLSDYLVAQEKEYTATALLGVTTDTMDITGKVTKQMDITVLTEEGIKFAFAQMEGVISQQVPIYSAVKQNGVPLYKLARRGVAVEAP